MNRHMKTVCDFCKTEYTLDAVPKAPVKCAVCGNTWVVHPPVRRNSILVFIAALCALLSAVVFAVVAISQHQIKTIREKPLVAEIQSIDTITDDNGVAHFVVAGNVKNRSEQIYGVPGLIVISYGEDDKIIDRQKFLPSATLLDAGAETKFLHVLSVPTQNVKKISVDLEKVGD